jgi:hypothetical protein
MVDICCNTNKFAGTRFEQRENLYLFPYDGSSSRNQQRRKEGTMRACIKDYLSVETDAVSALRDIFQVKHS